MLEREQGAGLGFVDAAELGQLSSLLHRDIRRQGVDPGTADDLVQEAWLRTLRSLPSVQSREGLGRWLRVVARRLVAELRRSNAHRHGRERRAARPEREVAAEVEVGEARVVALLRGLPDPYRTVLRLRFVEDRSVAEIAAELGSSPATVRSQLVRGVERLRARFEPRKGFGLAWLGAAVARFWRAPAALRWSSSAVVLVALVGLWRFALAVENGAATQLAAAASPIEAPAAVRTGERSPLAATRAEVSSAVSSSQLAPRFAPRAVSGVVRSPDGAPVAGARLWLGERLGEGVLVGASDARGRYSIAAVDAARFLWASAADWAPTRRVYVATIAAEREHDLVLTGSRGRLGLRVLTHERLPAAGVQVTLDGEPGGDRSHTTTSGALELAARFAIAGLTDERGFVELVKPALALPACEIRRGVEVLDCDELELALGDQDLELVLPPPAELRGVVRASDGEPAAGAVIELRQYEANVYLPVVADEAGRFLIRGLAAGEYAAMARDALSTSSALHTGRIAMGELAAIELRLSPHHALRGRATEEARLGGQPLAGALVRLYRSGQPGLPEDSLVHTDAEGRFAFVCMEGVEYRLELELPGEEFPCGTAESVRAGDEVELRVQHELRAREPLSIEFVSDAHAQLPTLVELRRWRPRIGHEIPVGADGRVSCALPPGDYELNAWVPGVGFWHGRRRLRTGPETQRVVLPRPGEVELVLDLPPGARAAFDAELIVGGLNPFGFEARGAFSHLRRFESDGSGRRYTALAFPGRCNYFVRAPGFADQTGALWVVEGELTRLQLAPVAGMLVELRLDYPRDALPGESMELWASGPAGRQRLHVAGAKSAADWLEFAAWVPVGTRTIEARSTRGLGGRADVGEGDVDGDAVGVRRVRVALRE